MAWNPAKGFYISPVVLDAPWQDEVNGIDTVIGEHNNAQTLTRSQFDQYITWRSFRSKDGRSETKPAVKGRSEHPNDYYWTPLYFENPVLRSTIDWFKGDKTRVRLARTVPGAMIDLHYDWDNALTNNDPDCLILRVWLQLDDVPAWYRLTNGIDDVTVMLQRGQFIVLNVDTVLHATQNAGDNPRSNIILHIKDNHWLRSLPELFRSYRVIDPRTDDSQ